MALRARLMIAHQASLVRFVFDGRQPSAGPEHTSPHPSRLAVARHRGARPASRLPDGLGRCPLDFMML